MALEWEQVIVDATDPVALGRWWADALDWVVVNDDPEEFEIRPAPDRLPGLLFARVPEPKTLKNRLHLDFRPDDRDAEVARFLDLGATRADVGQGADVGRFERSRGERVLRPCGPPPLIGGRTPRQTYFGRLPSTHDRMPPLGGPWPAPGEQLWEVRLEHAELVVPRVAHDPEVKAALLLVSSLWYQLGSVVVGERSGRGGVWASCRTGIG